MRRMLLWLTAPVDFWIQWNLAWLRVADELRRWPAALRNERQRRTLEESEEDNGCTS